MAMTYMVNGHENVPVEKQLNSEYDNSMQHANSYCDQTMGGSTQDAPIDAALDARFRDFNMNNTSTMRVLMPSYGSIIKQRARRCYIPTAEKDDTYWLRRRKNNEAAKLSRLKRRVFEISMEQRLSQLVDENTQLKEELNKLRLKFGVHEPLTTYSSVSSNEENSPQPMNHNNFMGEQSPTSSCVSMPPQDSCDSFSCTDNLELCVPSTDELKHVQEQFEQVGSPIGEKYCHLPHKLRHKLFPMP